MDFQTKPIATIVCHTLISLTQQLYETVIDSFKKVVHLMYKSQVKVFGGVGRKGNRRKMTVHST
jgi:hypothetical protein